MWLSIGKKSETGIHTSTRRARDIPTEREANYHECNLAGVIVENVDGRKGFMRKQIDGARDGGGISKRNCGVSERMCLEVQKVNIYLNSENLRTFD